MYVDTDLVWLIMPHTMHPLFAFTMHARVCRASPQSLSASLSPHEIYATWLRKYQTILADLHVGVTRIRRHCPKMKRTERQPQARR